MRRILTIALFVTTLPFSTRAAQAISISVDSSATNALVLDVTLKNLSTNTFQIFPEDLPWVRRAMIVAVYNTRWPEGDALKEEIYPAGTMHVTPRLKIAPNDELKGHIDLKQWFPEADNVLSRNDLIVFWSYQPKIKRLDTNRISGVLVLSAKRN
jgi:hypothetical protein